MRRRYILLTAVILQSFFTTLNAQDKIFTAGDYLNSSLRPASVHGLEWRGDMNVFTWIESNSLIQEKAAQPSEIDTLLSLRDLNTSLKKAKEDELSRFPSVRWMDADRFWFRVHNKLFIYDMTGSSVSKVNEYDGNGENINIDNSTLNVAYTIKNNLFVSVAGKTMQVTEEENPDIVNGQVPSRNEFGINAGSFWSPSS